MAELKAFAGFPPEGEKFFRQLAVNNNREWFLEHKQEYEDYLQTPAISLVVDLGERLKSKFPGINYDTRTNGAGSVMRIYRDVRFSKDKTPYKTHIGVNFWDGPQKKGTPGFHFFMDADAAAFYGGYHVFPKEFIGAYREAVAEDKTGEPFAKAMAKLQGTKGWKAGGDQLKRVPPGYDQDHSRGDLLKYKGLWIKAPAVPAEVLSSPKLIDVCLEHAKTMGDVHRWFAEVHKTVFQ